ncbi:MAG: LUD domain-containing protein [Candidatus Marinimicrobia bacterium]|nr:LUD domain-containing protein [Candidatus Neomarinimicrobiota bacterium]MBT4270289.1 LUD domain-containing protein [Candidatus Neomarinimicrobiota bacterium]MBT4371779.1 LUD domain-containing protein [Candidatus Neomarinimicrobiota bacterium]MBT4809042.1 LUD domain-containing protein [Candidatus Neomarinimicrobiota bacterium]MBT6130147.1 LUD domain-containing protein [Candidatus Neomarinimicrobiota bacterium]
MTDRYPDIKMIYSCVGSLGSKRITPETISNPHNLNSPELAVVDGLFGVAENVAIWVTVEQSGHRVLSFIAKYLVILLERESIVTDMHEAYGNIDLNQVPYGTFISGPSKTADIEHEPVMGAQGARSHTEVLT